MGSDRKYTVEELAGIAKAAGVFSQNSVTMPGTPGNPLELGTLPAALPHDAPIPSTANSDNPEGVDGILAERGLRYGKFKDHARITQTLMEVSDNFLRQYKDSSLASHLGDSQREALHMIFHKIGRILNGDPNYADSWIDIAGYAKLVADELEGVER